MIQWRSLDESPVSSLQSSAEDWRPKKTEGSASSAEDWRLQTEDSARFARREVLQLLGTAVAIPSLAACTRQPPEKIIPYVRAPEDLVLGRPQFYASALPHAGLARGVLVEAHAGRPTKIEGNPDHPASLGGTDSFAQAEILELYDPDRSQTVLELGAISSWTGLVSALQAKMIGLRSKQGEGLRILTGATSSPTLMAQLRALTDALPLARWHVYEPIDDAAAREGTRAVFGEPLDAVYHFDAADVVLSLDADPLGGDGQPRYLRDFAARRRPSADRGSSGGMNRLYAVASAPSLTAANADHRLSLRASEVAAAARRVAELVSTLLRESELPADAPAFLAAAARDLVISRGRALVVPGRMQPAVVHRIAHLLNVWLRGLGTTVTLVDPLTPHAPDVGTIAELARDLEAGSVDLLVMMGCNPVYTAPADLAFERALLQAKLRVHLGRHVDETAALCHWHVPEAHPLEAWSDARAYEGTISIIQPAIEPLYASKSAHELCAALSERPDQSGYDLVRAYWQAEWASPDAASFEASWRRVLHDGYLPDSERSAKSPAPKDDSLPRVDVPASQGLELTFRPDPTVYDGRYANNAWLQELPKPLSKLTWDNAALIAPALAAERGLKNGDVVELVLGERSVKAPVWLMPGHPSGAVTVHLGYGRRRAGKVGNGRGFDGYRLRTSAAPFFAAGLELRPTGERYPLASAQTHHSMEGRDLVRHAPVDAYLRDAAVLERHAHGPKHRLSMYDPHEYRGYSWAMAIDLSSCLGCSACVVACQAENNIAVVGKEEVMNGREMHWIRVDRYYEGEPDDPRTLFQPVPCMHCDNAPCEVVCPANATSHHEEGMNDMVYNRCVGTKFCANNCPYKVRRYNFFGYSTEAIAPLDPRAPTVRMAHNPDVTVRSYGVMEKCSYCVQRINYARTDAKKRGERMRDGEMMTACQAACPAQAITFGDINDPESQVSWRRAEPRHYQLLAELNTEPRTTYLARLDNPNLTLAPGEEHG